MNMLSSLIVRLYREEIGTITLLPGDRTIFTFNERYMDQSPLERPILSLSFLSKDQDLITNTRPYQTRLMPFFSNLLPEGLLRTYLAGRGNVKPEREFFLLKLLGFDLPGAITVDSVEDSADYFEKTNRDIMSQKEEGPLRFSLAGVQLKFSAILGKNKGLTISANGREGNWIVKLPSQIYPHVPENEESMLFLAREIGIQVPEFKLVSVKDIEGLPYKESFKSEHPLAVKRFDRDDDGSHVHIEDFAQVYGVYPEDKYKKVSYANIAKMIYTLGGVRDLEEYIKRLVFYILIGNGNMHLKNWSFIYNDKRNPMLSPAHDIVSTICYIPNDKMALNFSQTKEMQEIDLKMFERFAVQAGIPGRFVQRVALEAIEKIKAVWEREKKNLNLSKDTVNLMESYRDQCLLSQ
jgi:serine/threonine-protein kinase HipA